MEHALSKVLEKLRLGAVLQPGAAVDPLPPVGAGAPPATGRPLLPSGGG